MEFSLNWPWVVFISIKWLFMEPLHQQNNCIARPIYMTWELYFHYKQVSSTDWYLLLTWKLCIYNVGWKPPFNKYFLSEFLKNLNFLTMSLKSVMLYYGFKIFILYPEITRIKLILLRRELENSDIQTIRKFDRSETAIRFKWVKQKIRKILHRM